MAKNKGSSLKPEESFDKYLNAAGLVDRLEQVGAELEHGTPAEQNKARTELRQNSYDSLSINARPTKPEEMIPDQVEKGAKIYEDRSRQTSANHFRKSLGHLHNIDAARDSLEQMVFVEGVNSRISEGDKEEFDKYKAWVGLKRTSKKYDANGPLTEDERKQVLIAGAKGFAEEDTKRIREEDQANGDEFSDSLYETVKAASIIGVTNGDVEMSKLKPYVKGGLKKMTAEAKSNYEAVADGNDGIYKILGDAVKAWAEESPRDFSEANHTMYRASENILLR